MLALYSTLVFLLASPCLKTKYCIWLYSHRTEVSHHCPLRSRPEEARMFAECRRFLSSCCSSRCHRRTVRQELVSDRSLCTLDCLHHRSVNRLHGSQVRSLNHCPNWIRPLQQRQQEIYLMPVCLVIYLNFWNREPFEGRLTVICHKMF